MIIILRREENGKSRLEFNLTHASLSFIAYEADSLKVWSRIEAPGQVEHPREPRPAA